MIEVGRFPLYIRTIRSNPDLYERVPGGLLEKLGRVNSMKGGHIPFYIHDIEFLNELDTLIDQEY